MCQPRQKNESLKMLTHFELPSVIAVQSIRLNGECCVCLGLFSPWVWVHHSNFILKYFHCIQTGNTPWIPSGVWTCIPIWAISTSRSFVIWTFVPYIHTHSVELETCESWLEEYVLVDLKMLPRERVEYPLRCYLDHRVWWLVSHQPTGLVLQWRSCCGY